ncbi:hypothetical protein QUB56_20225 [Microcoleus sp. AR_TQ3_B6]|uniref:hypothetical protein n=1 Tax=Microcoleus sp. AR_TQ3_B6 TaxID=3055284 RepID=UPI002FD6E8C2
MQIAQEQIALPNQRAIELANNQSRSHSRSSRAIAAQLWDNAMAKATSQLF